MSSDSHGCLYWGKTTKEISLQVPFSPRRVLKRWVHSGAMLDD